MKSRERESDPHGGSLPATTECGAQPPGGSWRHFRLASCIAILTVYAIHAWFLHDFTIDDAAISYRYAENLATGAGLTWNPGTAPVEGFSNLLWVLLLAAMRILGAEIHVSAALLGPVFAALTIVALHRASFRALPDSPLSLVPGLLLALSPPWVAWSVSGLELALFGFLLFAAADSLESPSLGRWRLAVLCAALSLVRPEGAILAVIVIGAGYLGARPSPSALRLRGFHIPLLALSVTVLALTTFRLAYFGSLLPNTVHAKIDWTLPSAGRVAEWAYYVSPLVLAFLAALFGAKKRLPTSLQAAFALALAQALITMPVVPVMNFLHRYEIAFLPLVFLLLLPGMELASRRWPRVVWPVAGLLIVWILQGWGPVSERLRGERYMRERQRCVVERLLRLPGTPLVALQDAGFIPYQSRLQSMDAWGLCDAEIAREGFSPRIILERRPAVYVMSAHFIGEGNLRPSLGMDIMMLQDPDFQAHYGLWTLCFGGADTLSWTYDYAIFIDSEWAARNGFR